METPNDITQQEELKNLLKQINYSSLENVELKDIAPGYPTLSRDDFLLHFKKIIMKKPDCIIIDVRSEKEYFTNSIPFSINLPILNNIERHQVGLIYKQHSRELSLSMAYYFAKQKEKRYLKEITRLSNGKKIIIYCWRGGGRSRYVTNLLIKNKIEAIRLQGGQKGYRKLVHNFLYNSSIPIVSLSGITGCGKSEILEYIQKHYPHFPVLHLEECAGHASSVFGDIRFNLINRELTKNQQQFENNIFIEILQFKNGETLPVFLSEKESKKIGKLLIPPAILQGLEEEKHIRLNCTLDQRIERLAIDYFAQNNSDEKIKEKAKSRVKEQLNYLQKKLGNRTIAQYNEWIDGNQYYQFLKDIIVNYYDPIYRKSVKDPMLIIENKSNESTVKQIFDFWDMMNF